MTKKPLSYAPIHIVEGEQGSGKSNTMVARVVDAYKKDNTIKIYANFHLYGIPAVYLPLHRMIQYLNSGLIRDAYLLVDEGYIGGNSREGMTALVGVITKMANQIRKRHLHFYIATPNSRDLDWRFRWAKTENIMCSYDSKTKMITVMIKNKHKYKRPRIITYYASQYWKYYDTDEQFKIPEGQIAKALENVW